MAMMIAKFHKLLQSKILWLVILVVIALAFGIGGVALRGCDPSTDRYQENMSAGTLMGEPVDRREYRQAYFNVYLGLNLAYGNVPINKQVDAYLRDAAWKRLAALRRAAELGLQAVDSEIVEAIRSYPMFADESGRFNIQRYRAFVQQYLRQLRVSEVGFERYVREEITLQKMRRLIGQAVLLSPTELERTFHSISDLFSVDYVTVPRSAVTNDVEVTEAEARALFEADPEIYRLPEQVSVRYVRLAVTNYYDAEYTPDEEAMLAYYNRHIDDYIKEDETNGLDDIEIPAETETALDAPDDAAEAAAEADAVPADTNAALTLQGLDAPDAIESAAFEDAAATDDFFSALSDLSLLSTDAVETVYYSFEEVRGEIEDALRREAALEKAREEAVAMVNRMVPPRRGEAESFDDVVKGEGLDIRHTGFFSMMEGPADEDLPPEFARAAFTLRDNIDEYFSDPLTAEDGVYILALNERRESRVPAFEDVRERVMEDARIEAVARALEERAEDIRTAAMKAMEEGVAFTNAVAEMGLEPRSKNEFSASSNMQIDELDSEADPYLMDRLIRASVDRNGGEFADPVPTEDGVMLIYVRERKAGDPATFMSIREQIVESVRRERIGRLFEDWQESLLSTNQFQPKIPRFVEDDDDDRDEDEEEEAAPTDAPDGTDADAESS